MAPQIQSRIYTRLTDVTASGAFGSARRWVFGFRLPDRRRRRGNSPRHIGDDQAFGITNRICDRAG